MVDKNISSDNGRIARSMELADETAKLRQYDGRLGILTRAVLCLMPVVAIFFALGIPTYLRLALFAQQEVGAFLGLLLAAVFLLAPAHARASRHRLPWYDAILAAVGCAAGFNLALFFPTISLQMGHLSAGNMFLAVSTALLVLEATRRLLGWPLVVIGATFIFYARFSNFFPGMLQGKGYDFRRIFESLYYYPEGILGTPLTIAASIVVVFILFGRALIITRASETIADLSLALVGHMRGGPAKIAVIGSGLFGTISGSPASDVVATGSITIPLMKRIGYQPVFAGAVEAVASTGGAIMPPVMGAAAFLIAEYLGISYGQVALAAALPAALYYFCAFLQVDLRAGRYGLKGVPRHELPPLMKTLKNSYMVLVPLGVLVELLMGLNLPAQTAGLYAVVTVLLLSLIRKETRVNWQKAKELLVTTGQGLLEVGVVSAAAGIIVGVLILTGLGVNLSQVLVQAAGGNLVLLLVLTAAVSTVLGMGMPATPAYLILAVLVAPALISMGIPPLAAHLFIFYWGILSFLTPPVAVAAYIAAGLAKADPMRTGWQSVRLGITAFIVPFIFVFEPALILQGGIGEVVLAALTALLGIALLAVALEGFLFRVLKMWQRIPLAAAGLLTLVPGWTTDLPGLAVAAAILVLEIRQRPPAQPTSLP